MARTMGLGVLAVLVVAAVLYFGRNSGAISDSLTEQDLQSYLTQVMNRQAGVPVDRVGDIRVDQIGAFRTALRPHHSAAFDGYEIVLSGLDQATCNQVMKSPWVENAVLAKALTTQCDDPKAEIHLIMAAR